MRLLPVLALASWSLGCGADTTDTVEPEPTAPLTLEECPGNSICSGVSVESNDVLMQGDAYTEGQRCALQAFLDGTPGHIGVATAGGDSPASTHFVITPLGDVVRQRRGYRNGEGPWRDDAEVCSPVAASFFETCLDAFDDNCLLPTFWLTCAGDLTSSCP